MYITADSLLHGTTKKSGTIDQSIPSSEEVSRSQIPPLSGAGFNGEKKAANGPPYPRYQHI